MRTPSSSICDDDDDGACSQLICAIFSSLKSGLNKKLDLYADALKSISNAATNMEKEIIKMHHSHRLLEYKKKHY